MKKPSVSVFKLSPRIINPDSFNEEIVELVIISGTPKEIDSEPHRDELV